MHPFFRLSFLIIASIAFQSVAAQKNIKSPDETALPVDSEAVKMVPPGYKLLDSGSGDMNLDGLEDKFIAVEKGTGDQEKRLLLVFVRDSNGRLKLGASSFKAILCSTCGGVCCGDPYQGTNILENGDLVTEHYGGSNKRWNIKTTYAYSSAEKTWLLRESFTRLSDLMDPEGGYREIVKTPLDFGKVNFEEYSPGE